jgi:Ni,Fe-hydrogenase maturation factor
MKRLFLCAGSESEGDSLAFEICDILRNKIKNHDFAKTQNPFEIANHARKRDVVIIDVVKGLEKTRMFSGADKFSATKSVTTHDLDVCIVLKMMEATEKKKFRIIGVPFGSDRAKAAKEVGKIISSLD